MNLPGEAIGPLTNISKKLIATCDFPGEGGPDPCRKTISYLWKLVLHVRFLQWFPSKLMRF